MLWVGQHWLRSHAAMKGRQAAPQGCEEVSHAPWLTRFATRVAVFQQPEAEHPASLLIPSSVLILQEQTKEGRA